MAAVDVRPPLVVLAIIVFVYSRRCPMNSKKFFMILTMLLALVPMTAFGGNLPSAGAVYVMSNSPEGNQVVVFERNSRGLLTLTDSFVTTGLGSG
jgi:hypothetical protein